MKHLSDLIFKIFLVFCILFLFSSKTFAKNNGSDTYSTSENIDATVNLSVCGDGIAEGREDCDGTDLGNENCIKLGYKKGDLSCDISCEFDTVNCSGVLVTPIPTPTPTATPTQSSSSTSTTSTTTETITTAKKEDNLIKKIIREIDLKLKLIQKNFDFDSSGKIEVYELYNTVRAWVEDWKFNIEIQTAYAKGEIVEEDVLKPEKCDLNNDGVCNVIDLSILLYYIER